MNPRKINFELAHETTPVIKPKTYEFKYLKDVWADFAYQSAIAMSVILAPPVLADSCITWERAMVAAYIKMYPDDKSDPTLFSQIETPEQHDTLSELTFKNYDLHLSLADNDLVIHGRNVCASMVDKLLSITDQSTLEIFENVLKSFLIQSWSAFEVLTKNLWHHVKALNDPRFIVPNKPRFASLESIQQTYAKSFNNTDITKYINDSHIKPLSKLRNVFVHNHGLVDENFKKGLEDYPELSRYFQLQEGEEILIEGGLAKSIVEQTFTSANRLIIAVDLWLDGKL